MIIAHFFNMNTTMMTICRIIAPSPTVGNNPLINKSPERLSQEEITAAGETTDKSGNKTKNKQTQSNEPRFNDTLREKMNAESPEQVHGQNDQTNKDIEPEKNDNSYQVTVPTCSIYDQPEETVVFQPETDNSESTQNIPVTETVAVPPIKAGEIEKNATISPKNESSAFTGTPGNHLSKPTIAQPNAEIPASENAINPPHEKQNPVESIPAIQPEAVKSEQIPEKIGSSEGNPGEVKPASHPMASTAATAENVSRPPDPEGPKLSVDNKLGESKQADNEISEFTKNTSSPQQKMPVQKELNTKTEMIRSMNDVQPQTLQNRTPIHKLNLSMEQIEALRPEKVKNSAENRDFSSPLDDLASAETSAPVDDAKLPITGRTAEISINSGSKLTVGPQIQESVAGSYRPGMQQIVIRLDPPDLGRVTIRFVEQRDGITGVLHVDKADTKYDIQQALPGIIQNLQNSDIQIRKLEVVLNNQQQTNFAGDHSAEHEGGFEQQHSSDRGAFDTADSFQGLPASGNIHQSTNPHIELSEQSINMLI